MRYVVSFYHGKSLRVDEKTAPAFVQAMKTKEPVLYKGQAFAGASIQLVRPAYQVEADERQNAMSHNEFRCKYGYTHPNRSECGCKDARFNKILDDEEELLLKNYIKESFPALGSGDSYPKLIERINDGDMVDNSELQSSIQQQEIISDKMVKISDIINAQH